MTGTAQKPTTTERILLVDDNKLGLSVRKVVLEELGYNVTAVCCSLQALETFNSETFDLVVTDYRMPHLNGIELIGRIREGKPHMPVVLISGVVDALGLDEQNTGADVVIQKSAHEDATLTRAVSRLLSRRVPRKPVSPQRSVRARRSVAAR